MRQSKPENGEEKRTLTVSRFSNNDQPTSSGSTRYPVKQNAAFEGGMAGNRETRNNPEVRRQSIFWLGQSRGPRATAFIEEILTR
jgi:hypothetical protein